MTDEFLDLLEDTLKRLSRAITISQTNRDRVAWSTKYDLIFSQQLHGKIMENLQALGMDDEWRCCDMGYQEDVNSFVLFAVGAHTEIKTILDTIKESEGI